MPVAPMADAEKCERITTAGAGKPVAQLVPSKKSKALHVPPNDPLLNLDSFAVEGPGGKLTNKDINQLLYRRTM